MSIRTWFCRHRRATLREIWPDHVIVTCDRCGKRLRLTYSQADLKAAYQRVMKEDIDANHTGRPGQDQ